MNTTKEELALTIDESEWSWLRPHLERGTLVLVADSLDLADAALKVTADDSATIEQWINDGKIGKPSETQILHWNGEKQKKFAMLIVSPYVLIQERLPTFH
ncbi:MAG: DUF2288 domain-containing protein [Desulfuromonadales bacterium]|nr:DUF2288 domain-containing protein [Desulfuromonadales bacterium]